VHHGRIVKRTGDGSLIEFRSVVDAVRCAIEVQNGMVERNAGLPPERRIDFRVGIHLGDVVEEADGDLMGDGVNIAARLEGIAAPGAICLSEDAYRQVKGRLDLKVTDLGPTQLKNIAEPIRVYSLEVGKPKQAKPAPPDDRPTAAKRRWGSAPLAAAIAALLILAVASGWTLLGWRGVRPTEAARLSIVVLPFTNLSGDPAQDYFADGVTDNLTTELSRIPNSFVIARNTAFTFKGKAVDAKEIGAALGVRYVLEGSVQRDQSRVRVNAQLVDAESGSHVWADRFEEDVADLFKLQDEVVVRLANTLGYELVKAEAERSVRSKSPDSIDLTMRGWALVWQGYQQPLKERKQTYGAAIELFEQALKLDPNDPDALAGDAFTYFIEFANGLESPEIDLETKIVAQADRAIALAHGYDRAYYAKSVYLSFTRRLNEALSTANTGLTFDPNSPWIHGARAVAEISLGLFEQAKSDSQQAIRLSPRDPGIGLRYVQEGDAELGMGHLDAARDNYNKAIESGMQVFIPYANLAAVDALAGKKDEAKPLLAEARRLNPQLTVKWMIAHAPNLPPLFDGLRKAGLSEE
jgi:adenylate cyclase